MLEYLQCFVQIQNLKMYWFDPSVRGTLSLDINILVKFDQKNYRHMWL